MLSGPHNFCFLSFNTEKTIFKKPTMGETTMITFSNTIMYPSIRHPLSHLVVVGVMVVVCVCARARVCVCVEETVYE